MGSSVSICNATAVILNVALRHAAPLYYRNELMPDECHHFKTGQVWFTVEARIWTNGTNNFNDFQVGLPILGATLVAPVAAAGLGLAVSSINSSNFNEIDFKFSNSTNLTNTEIVGIGIGTAAIPAFAVTAGGAIINLDWTPKEWTAFKYGVYMTPGKKITVEGGPTGWRGISPEGKLLQFVEKPYTELSIRI